MIKKFTANANLNFTANANLILICGRLCQWTITTMDRERVQRQDNGTGREVQVSDGDVGSASGADDIVTAKNGKLLYVL